MGKSKLGARRHQTCKSKIGQSEDVGFASNLKAFSIESSAQFNWFAGYGDRLAQNLVSNVFGWISEKLEIPLGWQDALEN